MNGDQAQPSTLHGQEIVCVGFAEWSSELPTNQHHLMSRLAVTNRVLFIESLGLRRPQLARRDVRRLFRRLVDGLHGPRREGDITVVSPIGLPAHGNRVVRALNRRLLQLQVRRSVDRLGFKDPILWAYVPHAEALVSTLDPSLVVYHCVDDLAAQKGVHASSFRESENRFARRADLVLASAPSLVARLTAMSDRVVYAPNVADIDFFATAIDAGPIDDALAQLPPPRIVFTGAIVETKVDMKWLVDLARLRPAWSFALVGPVGFGDPQTDVSALRAAPNIHVLGPRPYRRLPEVLRGADAGLIPYAMNDLTASVFPMKVYEYIAAGLPVIATPLPALRDVVGVTLVSDPREAASCLDRVIAETSRERRLDRARLARGHSWADRLGQIAIAVDSLRPRTEPHWSVGDLVIDLQQLRS